MEAAVTETTDREDLAEKASEFLLGVLERMGISADIDIKDDTDKTVLEIQTGDTELVIGRRGVARCGGGAQPPAAQEAPTIAHGGSCD